MSDLIAVSDQRERILSGMRPLTAQHLPLTEAHGLRLVEAVHARFPVPPWDNSAMDGYAVRFADVAGAAADTPVTLDVVADLPAGSGLDPALGQGQAARIMTGAVLPTDADTVVQLEHTDRTDPHGALAATVTVNQPQTHGRHVRSAGGDMMPGDLVAPAGTYLNATALASLASTGQGRVGVHPRAKVAVIATGSELLPPGADLARGQIPDSNSLLISALARQAGAEVVSAAPVGDDPAELADHLAQVEPQADVIVLTGGVSAGAYDPLTRVFAGSEEVTFSKVAMQPGKPQAFGRYGGAWLFGLPGNPVSAWVSFHVFVRPALQLLHGAPPDVVLPATVPARVTQGWRTPPVRDQYLPARVRHGADGHAEISPTARHGSQSHLVASLARANGYAIVPGHVDHVEPGDIVEAVVEPGGHL
ncbi:molybdenum cofactor synthesis domain-containing protein [Pseudactinotalea sp. Z1732]|uniref:molybdopterin molybdotransferase MoeA n=1 Tax=Micrococcales TaxID=85006 RepID=UPI003C7C23CA